jgi:hypothetical protein
MPAGITDLAATYDIVDACVFEVFVFNLVHTLHISLDRGMLRLKYSPHSILLLDYSFISYSQLFLVN